MLGRILRLMRMRNIVIASIFGSGYGYYHNHTFFPNFKAFRDYIDNLDFGEYLNFDKESLIKSLYGANDLFKDNIHKYSDVIHDAYVDMLKKLFVPIEYTTETNQNFLSQFDDFALTNGSMSFMPFPSLNSNSTKQNASNEKTAQDDLLELQLKYQKEIENLERENKELRKQLILKSRSKANEKSKRIKKSVIDLYSEVLDDLNEYDSKYNVQDHLPKIVVVGDQSSGKTSVLEMIAQARIFPRGSGEMMTRSPVKVTLSEGPYHIAQFKDSEREFDLSKEKDLAALRREIELRMVRGLKDGKTISTDTVALTVKGPGLPRMVLIDLPGIISTVTTDMAPDTKDAITKLVKTYMANPNSIIMCIQDGSVDAERSNVTDLVSSIDPAGHRTIFVLTKVDMAEQNLFNPARVKKILEGKLFPMKALGYFAVVTGRGNSEDSIASIKSYEEDFFRNSKLFKAGVFRPHQMTTHNMSLAVSECFWKMVRESIEQQADSFKAVRFNLETEWKNSFPKLRELDREELFEKARTEILDEILGLNHVTSKQWEELLFSALWGKVNDFVIENIYIQALTQSSANPDSINTLYDIKLRQWAEHGLPQKSVQTGWESLESQIQFFLNKSKSDSQHDELFDPLKKAVLDQANEKHQWDQKAIDSLRVIQLNALEDRSIIDKYQWDVGLKFFEKTIQDRLHAIENVIKESRGPSVAEQWLYWKTKTTQHHVQALIQDELDAVYKARVKNGAAMNKKKESGDLTGLENVRKSHLEPEEILVVKKSVQNKGYDDVDEEAIKNAWYYVFRNNFFMETLDNAKECRKAFYYYQQQGSSRDKTFYRCNDVVLFWRINRMLQSTSNALRQQITNAEARRFEKEIKEILDDLSQDKDKLETLLTGRRVTLAEELKRVRHIQEKIDEFMQALNKEKS